MNPTVYFIEGDGIGPEVWKAARPVIDRAVELSYTDGRALDWQELLAGKKAYAATGSYLPEATLETLKQASLAMKGPLETPVGGGFRSLNVTLRQTLDLYACIRPIRYFPGIESPVKHPERVNMVVFRENTEDVYAGIEWPAGSPEANRLIAFLRDELGRNVDPASGIGIKPMTEHGSKRLVRRAIRFALDQGRTSVTLVHKGNIMKYTEGAFRAWGYEVAAQEFAGQVAPEGQEACPPAAVTIKDRIADAMFQEVLIRPEAYDVIATTNLNGDYLSDALAAQVGGLGLAPGVNMSDTLAFFEPTHGTAPSIAGKDLANPGSLVLSGALLLEHLGWKEAADRIHRAVERVIAQRTVTVDLATQMPGAQQVGCAAFGERLLAALEA
ncbi:MAG: Isocitrate dehydrogenase [Desulfomicrobiaceae bacterium]|jgi:isocitrate dehydrogenase|nr:Isocitrate dehydrogenase [Desulfomicrobiaceae bacterium]MBZ4686032.1 Isocitrate dehydrogenase [Desulfomicrobiaceae bacterium]MDI3492456.1 isocitrate dehydrogenase [Desulfomicrobiaceae bacterium]MDK2873485.1 isocitrate dehydrogenase [Desulfomicrobiaceae bacterium]HCF04684.1 NADP-dependent isocitrate dehydrogenase [Desulfomicrobiaceae bacterium]